MKKFVKKFTILFAGCSLFLSTVEAANHVGVSDPVAKTTNEVPKSEVKKALKEFKRTTKEEKTARYDAVKAELKKYQEAKSAGQEPSTNTLLLAILAILLPPLAVYLHQGEINTKFWISLILTLLFWLPGVIYALVVIFGGA